MTGQAYAGWCTQDDFRRLHARDAGCVTYDRDHAIGGQRGDRRCPARGTVLRLVHRDRRTRAHRPGTGRAAQRERVPATPPLELVEQREAALLEGDRDAFLATVDDDELQFVATQARWFDNLSAMPVGGLRLEPRGRARAGAEAPRAASSSCRSTSPCGSTASSSTASRSGCSTRSGRSTARSCSSTTATPRRDRRDGLAPGPLGRRRRGGPRERARSSRFFDEETAPYADRRHEATSRPRRRRSSLRCRTGPGSSWPTTSPTSPASRSAPPCACGRRAASPIPSRSAPARADRGLSLHRQSGRGPQQPEARVPAAPRAGPRGAGQQGRRTALAGWRRAPPSTCPGPSTPPTQQRLMAAYVRVLPRHRPHPPWPTARSSTSTPTLNYALAAAACTYLAATRGRAEPVGPDGCLHRRARPARAGRTALGGAGRRGPPPGDRPRQPRGWSGPPSPWAIRGG